MVPVDAIWLTTESQDMCAGTEAALSRSVAVFGVARAHHANCVANRRANRMKVLAHDGIGVQLAAHRLNRGKFVWADALRGPHVAVDSDQWQALALGLPWQHVGAAGAISVL